jgi:hypothetical protein
MLRTVISFSVFIRPGMSCIPFESEIVIHRPEQHFTALPKKGFVHTCPSQCSGSKRSLPSRESFDCGSCKRDAHNMARKTLQTRPSVGRQIFIRWLHLAQHEIKTLRNITAVFYVLNPLVAHREISVAVSCQKCTCARSPGPRWSVVFGARI